MLLSLDALELDELLLDDDDELLLDDEDDEDSLLSELTDELDVLLPLDSLEELMLLEVLDDEELEDELLLLELDDEELALELLKLELLVEIDDRLDDHEELLDSSSMYRIPNDPL